MPSMAPVEVLYFWPFRRWLRARRRHRKGRFFRGVWDGIPKRFIHFHWEHHGKKTSEFHSCRIILVLQKSYLTDHVLKTRHQPFTRHLGMVFTCFYHISMVVTGGLLIIFTTEVGPPTSPSCQVSAPSSWRWVMDRRSCGSHDVLINTIQMMDVGSCWRVAWWILMLDDVGHCAFLFR